MASPEEIANLQERLTIHRRNLATLLKQHALSGEMHAPLTITNGINEARSKIQQIKQILRGWQVPAPDSPDDGDAPLSFAPQARRSRPLSLARRCRPWRLASPCSAMRRAMVRHRP